MQLQGSLCLLRPHRDSDIRAMLVHFNIPEVYQMLRTPVPFTEEDARKRMRHEQLFAIEVDNAYAGEIAIHSVVQDHKAELFYSLSPKLWGRGIMTQAIQLITDWAFEEFKLIRLQAYVYSNNPASAHILEKCGFHREGTLEKDTIRLGVLLDRWMYAWLKA